MSRSLTQLLADLTPDYPWLAGGMMLTDAQILRLYKSGQITPDEVRKLQGASRHRTNKYLREQGYEEG